MKLTLGKSTWIVWTNPDIHGSFATQVSWAWTAFGPQGSDSGVCESADEAVAKAHSAAIVLADPRQWQKKEAS